jgi:hypothetical protein
MNILKNGLLAAIVGAGASVAFLLNFISLEIFITILGVGGFSGIAGFRKYIESSGYKTYIVAIGGALVSAGIGFGIIPPENGAVLLGALGIVSVPTLTHAVKKSNGK